MGYRTLKIPPPKKEIQSKKSQRYAQEIPKCCSSLPCRKKKKEETGSNTKLKLDNGYQTLDNLGIQ